MDRDLSIDILRSIALLGIVLIHCGPDSLFLQQIRNFDVPLMVYLSGVSYSISQGNTAVNYKDYVIKRFKRLILPTWIFLCIYNLLMFITSGHFLPADIFLRYSLFYTGWYVWIIRVFFIIAICAPLVLPYFYKVTLKKSLIIILVALVVNEFISTLIDNYLYYLFVINIPYLVFFIMGGLSNRFSNKTFFVILLLSSILYCSISIYLYLYNDHFVLTSSYKYPPRLYYSLYALMSITFLWLIRLKIYSFLKYIKCDKFFLFIGSHTIWIYFWHIPLLSFVNRFNLVFWERYLLVFIISLTITFFQNKTIDHFFLGINNKLSKNIKILFKG